MSLENKGSMATTVTISMEPDRSGNYVCSGVADNVEIQAAIDYVTSSSLGGRIYIKRGIYNIGNNGLTVPHDVPLAFVGPTPFDYGHQHGATIVYTGTDYALKATGYDAVNEHAMWELKNLTFWLTNANYKGGVYTEGVERGVIQSVMVWSTAGSPAALSAGFYLYSTSGSMWSIYDCTAHGVAIGFLIGEDLVSLYRCYASTCEAGFVATAYVAGPEGQTNYGAHCVLLGAKLSHVRAEPLIYGRGRLHVSTQLCTTPLWPGIISGLHVPPRVQ